MARTPEAIRTALEQEHPTIAMMVNDERIVLDPQDPETAAAYAERMSEWVANTVAAESGQDAAQEALAEFATIRPLYKKLKAGTATAAEQRQVLQFISKKVFQLYAQDAEAPS